MSVTVNQTKNYVGGEWVDSVGGGTMDVLNPATGEVIAEVPSGTSDDVDRVVESARKALPEWLEQTPGERSTMMLALADAIDENAEELAQLESLNVGKPIEVARAEPPAMSDCLRFFAGAPGTSRARTRASTCAATRR